MSDDNYSLTYISTTCIIASIGALVIAFLVVAYRVARPHFPVVVNCWFCNKDSKVPYGNKTCWDCPFCEQYNGFTEDGDYNKAIPAQSKENLNHPVSIENRNAKEYTAKPSALCEACNRNQLLKVRQLANFVPYNDANYDMEVEGYRFHLEQIYRLCRPCQLNVDKVLEEQNKKMEESIGNTFSKSQSPDSSFSVLENSLCSSHISCRLSAPWHVKILRWSSLLCAVSLFLVALINLLEHSHSVIEPSQWLPNIVMIYCTALYKSIKMVILLGLVTGLLAIYRFGKHSLHICDAVSCMVWLLTLAVFSDPVTSKLKIEDVFLLQSICTTANMVVCLWGSFCPRFEASNSKRVRSRRRKYLNLSGTSLGSNSVMSESHNSTLSEDNDRRSTVSAPNIRSQKTCDNEHLEKFETMSLGKPCKKGLRSAGIFTVKNDSQPSQSQASPVKSTLDSLRQRKPLISPARFKPSVSSSSDSRTTAPRKLFSSSQSQWKGGLFAGHSQSNDVDGNESVFSVPRTTRDDYSEDEEESASQRSRSSYCPVGSTETDGAVTCQLNDKPRSIFTRIFFGVSLGINIALVFYFIVDFNNMSNNLENIKDKIINLTAIVYENPGTLKDNLISICKTMYDYGMVISNRLTQDIPGEGTS